MFQLWIVAALGCAAAVFASGHWWRSDIEAHLGTMSTQWIAEQRADESRHRPYR